jgi:cytoskeletal protein CcmA (bactofilin family)
MWNKKEDSPKSFNPPSPAPSQAAMPPSFTESKKEATPMSSMPGRVESETRGSAVIGKAVKIVGQIFSKEDLFVDGDVEGTVEALEHRLIIGPHGTVHATVKAREVVAQGNVQGNVEATEKIEIRKDAKLVGDIRTARIIIEDGAYFKGSIDIVKPEPAKTAPKPPQASPSNAQPAAAGAPHSKS